MYNKVKETKGKKSHQQNQKLHCFSVTQGRGLKQCLQKIKTDTINVYHHNFQMKQNSTSSENIKNISPKMETDTQNIKI